MNTIYTLIDFLKQNKLKILEQTFTHVNLTLASVIIAVILGMPLGILITRNKRVATLVLGLSGVFQTIPSIALLGFTIPLLGIGAKPAIFALFIYALLPIIRNTFTGINEVDPVVKEAAHAMGMSRWQILSKVEIPLALPTMFAGIRTAAVINVGVATLAAYIAAGGLGEFIFGGIALNNINMMLAGAIPAALLALLFDFVLARVEKINLRKLRYVFIFFLLISFASFITYLVNLRSSHLLAGFAHEFIGRDDGYPGLQKKYGLNLKTVLIDQSLMYEAIRQKEVDIISGYTTDGRIKAYKLEVLKDDRQSFPPYFASPVVRNDVLKKHPELLSALNLLAGKITDEVMTALNFKVDHLKQSPALVAETFLRETGLYRLPQTPGSQTIKIGSKVFTEQYILAELFSLMIKGYTNLNVDKKTGLGGTKICFDALRAGQIDLYPEYSGTGLLVILQPDEKVTKMVTVDKERTYKYVDETFNKRFDIDWLEPLGFNNSYALVMRQSQAKALNIHSISALEKASK